MNILQNYLSLAILTLLGFSMAAQDKFINRVKNSSKEHTIYIAPFQRDIQDDKPVINPGYSITALNDFDVTLEEPILVQGEDETTLVVSVGEKDSEISLSTLNKGNNTLLIDEQGTVRVEPSENGETATQGLFDTESDGTFTYKEKYISKIENNSNSRTIHILPFWNRYIMFPSGIKGYTVSNSSAGWETSLDLTEQPLLISVDENNTGLVIKVDGTSLRFNPKELKGLKEYNTLTIEANGSIKLKPFEKEIPID